MQNTGFINGNTDWNSTLVVVFLRGGADGLNMVIPTDDDSYFAARPLIGVAGKNTIRLGDMFGLHPRLGALAELYREGALAIVHGVGSEDTTRSHFEAQDTMEHGGSAGGWLARYLTHRPTSSRGSLSAVSVGRALPESLRGSPSCVVFESFDDFRLGEDGNRFMSALQNLYAEEDGPLGAAARSTLGAVRKLNELGDSTYTPANTAVYPPTSFGDGLARIACLVKARVGLEAATIDLGGWDSHFAQATLIEPRMTELAEGLRAFYRDLAEYMNRTSVVVMTEFGRRVYENASLGTDHGRGSVMFVLGGGVRGGKMYSDWKGLDAAHLEEPGDLPVTYNYRNVLAPILDRHGGAEAAARVFPLFEFNPLQLYA
ncbi:MAG: hypothetical protein AMXMBFR4_32740 [Candidatus Hydrogenedentota bacterium]